MDQTPPAVNLKCIVFTFVLATGYWYLPPRNKYVLAALAYFPYLALAWYDWIYACQHNFGPTYLANYYEWAKPQNSRQIKIYKNWDPKIKHKIIFVDLVILITIAILLPKFISWKPKAMTEKEEKNAKMRATVIFILVLLLFGYLRYYKN